MGNHNHDPNQNEIAGLQRSVTELSILNELALAIGASLDFDEVMDTVIKRSCRAVSGAQATITMVEREDVGVGGTLVRGIVRDTPDFHLTQNLVGMMALQKKPLLFNNPHHDDRLTHVPLQHSIRNLVCVPLLVGNEMVGILAAFNKRAEGDFDGDDLRVLSIIGAQSAQILERARLFALEQASSKIREEIRMATAIQMSLLPSDMPTVVGYQIFGMTRPALQVGGDYFDYIELASGHQAVAIGDVSGKGVPASLLMANLQATLRSLALQETDCRSCVRICSELLYRSTSRAKFATLFYCTIDPESHQIDYCNAGHERPLILGVDDSIRTLDIGGLPAGVLPEFDYEGGSASLAPGEILVMYSDGVPDMLDCFDESYGIERLHECILGSRDESAETIARMLVECVQTHAGECAPMDDVTVVVVKRVE